MSSNFDCMWWRTKRLFGPLPFAKGLRDFWALAKWAILYFFAMSPKEKSASLTVISAITVFRVRNSYCDNSFPYFPLESISLYCNTVKPGSLDSPYNESRWIKIKSKSFIVLPDYLAWIDLNNKIALKQPLIKTEQNKLTFKLSGNTINTLI